MALSHEVGHLFGAVACFDPKLSDYVICITHDPEFELGQQLSGALVADERADENHGREREEGVNGVKVALCGPPQSGNSCLREGLKNALREVSGVPYCYAITACPDGEGAWYQETVNRDAGLAGQLKREYKGDFTDEFTELAAGWVANCVEPLTLVDIGGIPDEKNEKICSGATHAILLAGDTNKFQEWRNFCEKVGLQILAEIESDYLGAADQVKENDNGRLIGSIHHLERGEPIVDRPMVRALARRLAVLASGSTSQV